MAHIRILKHYFHVPFLLLGLVEGVVLVGSVYLAAFFRFDSMEAMVDLGVGPLWPRAVLFALLVLVSMTAMGVYQARGREGLSGVTLRTAVSYFFGAASLFVIFYLFPSLYLGRGVLIMAAVISFVTLLFMRAALSQVVGEDTLKRKVLVLGAGERAKIIHDKVQAEGETRGFLLCGFVAAPDESVAVDPSRIIPQSGTLLNLAEQYDVEEIVVAIDDRRRYFPLDELLDCKMGGIDVVDIINFFERETGKVEVGLLHPSWLVFSDGFSHGATRDLFERWFDVGVSALLFLITWPVMIITICAIWLEEGFGASIFYRQTRVGLDGRHFDVFKFRSMRENAEQGVAQWAATNDDRITRVGQIIRKYRVDELPQFINVLKGDMGLVGPRPERPEFVDQLVDRIPFYSDRHRVKPGITGWAQLCYPYGASEQDAKMKLKYDLYYVKNHSLMLDVLILVQTVEVIIFGKGAR
ncbi:MAG: TIGR03013 family PEP-CTERM/XrtA system glycosyltransferase [Gammaproteobacteria bacterium]